MTKERFFSILFLLGFMYNSQRKINPIIHLVTEDNNYYFTNADEIDKFEKSKDKTLNVTFIDKQHFNIPITYKRRKINIDDLREVIYGHPFRVSRYRIALNDIIQEMVWKFN